MFKSCQARIRQERDAIFVSSSSKFHRTMALCVCKNQLPECVLPPLRFCENRRPESFCRHFVLYQFCIPPHRGAVRPRNRFFIFSSLFRSYLAKAEVQLREEDRDNRKNGELNIIEMILAEFRSVVGAVTIVDKDVLRFYPSRKTLIQFDYLITYVKDLTLENLG